MENVLHNKRIKRYTQILNGELHTFTPTKDQEFIYKFDYRGESAMGWIVVIETKEIRRTSDKNINTIEWID